MIGSSDVTPFYKSRGMTDEDRDKGRRTKGTSFYVQPKSINRERSPEFLSRVSPDISRVWQSEEAIVGIQIEHPGGSICDSKAAFTAEHTRAWEAPESIYGNRSGWQTDFWGSDQPYIVFETKEACDLEKSLFVPRANEEFLSIVVQEEETFERALKNPFECDFLCHFDITQTWKQENRLYSNIDVAVIGEISYAMDSNVMYLKLDWENVKRRIPQMRPIEFRWVES